MSLPSDTVVWSLGDPVDPRFPLFIQQDASAYWEEWTVWYPEIGEAIRRLPNAMWSLFLSRTGAHDQALIYPLEIVDVRTFEIIKANIHHPSPHWFSHYTYDHYAVQSGMHDAVVCSGKKILGPAELRAYAVY